MRYCFFALALLLPLLGFITTPHPSQEVVDLWHNLAPGIDYREFYLPDPNHLYVARMDRRNPAVTLESSIALGRLSGGVETVRQMAERYDQAISYWGENWGVRNQVVVAINGSFYNPDTGVPWSGQVHSGWYAKRFADRESGSGFAWTLDRVAFVGGCIVHRPAKQLIIYASGDSQEFTGINIPRGKNDVVIYTPQYDATTLTDDSGSEVVVEMSRPLMVMPAPAVVTGTIQDIREGQGATFIPFNSIVLSAGREASEKLLENVRLGDKISFSQEISHFAPDCQTPNPLSWSKTFSSVASSFSFLRQGILQSFEDLGAILRNPRTAIAFNDDYVYFIVVDGRDRFRSKGVSMVELAVFAKYYLGAVWGVALDGGGSSTMVVNGEVVNRPITGIEEQEGNKPSSNMLVERAVANGMMMVVILPKQQSELFKPGDQIRTTGYAEVFLRLGPGTNYAILASIPPNSPGVILKEENQLNGVFAKGTYWWRVAFGNLVGWVTELELVK